MKKLIIYTVFLVFTASGAFSVETAQEPFSQPLPIPPVLVDEDPSTPQIELSLTAMKGEKMFFKNILSRR